MLWYSIRYGVFKWKIIQGIYIPVHINYGYSVLRFIDNSEYEKSEITIIQNTLSNDDRILELGTGIGFVSAYCARQIGSDRVFTYEGNPEMKPLIDELYNKNNVTPDSTIALLGSSNGTKRFYKNGKNFLASSSDMITDEHPPLDIQEQSLNEVIANIKPTYFIMDIEGGEYDIFKIINFQSILKIQFELHPSVLKETQINFIFEKLKGANFIRSELFNYSNNFYFTRKDSQAPGS
ncbi:MAG TPA: FkbM family methyltransferase [Chitinophagaceae bacterium]|nr:FkbM family methyltransferase [Chitinophagaceae bacterium]